MTLTPSQEQQFAAVRVAAGMLPWNAPAEDIVAIAREIQVRKYIKRCRLDSSSSSEDQ